MNAYAQRGETGMVQVQTLDKDGKPLSGALVTLFVQVGQPVNPAKSTDENGKLELTMVPVGQYSLQVEAENYQTFNEDKIKVLEKTITSISIQMTEKINVSEIVTVNAESEKLIEQGALPQAQFSQEALKTVPLQSQEFDQALPIVPNVIRGPDGKINIKGAREDQNLLLVNDADATDPATGNFALSIPLESIGQVKVYTNPYLPEYGKFTGGVTKIETKRGGDKWKFDINDIFPEPRLRGGKLFGFTNFSPRIHFEGPVVKNRFYLAQGLEYAIDKKPVRGLPSPNNEIIKDLVRSFSQFDLIISAQNTISITFNFSPRIIKHIGLDFFNPQSVAPNQRLTDTSLVVIDRLALSGGSLLETLFQYKRLKGRIFGEGPDQMLITPLGRSGNYFHLEKRTTERYELHFTDTLPPYSAAGEHNFKIGAGVEYLSNRGFNQNQTVTISRADGTTSQRIAYLAPGDLNAINRKVFVFAQDQWLILPNLSFDYGLRFEAQRATVGLNVAPRMAVSYSPVPSGNTVFRAAFGIFYDKLPLNALSFANASQQQVTTFAADGKTITDGPRHFVNLIASRSNGKPNNGLDFTTPRNITFNTEFNQRLGKHTLLKISYLNSRTHNDLYVSPVIDQKLNSITLFNNGLGLYNSLEVTSSFQLPKENDFSVSYIRSRTRGELNDFNTYFGDFPDPVLRPNQFGRLQSDAPNRLLMRGTFKFPYMLTVAPLFDLHTGFPYSVRDELQNFVGQRNSERYLRFLSLDLAVSKDIRLRDKYTAQFTVSIFNVTDHNNPRNVRANIADPGFGKFFARYRRFYRLDFGFTW
jgi:hypothetical protein